MSPNSSFCFGLALAVLLLLAGIALGLWLGRRRAILQNDRDAESGHVLNMVGGLIRWTNGVAGDVSDYQRIVTGVAQRIEAVEQSDEPDMERTASGLLAALVEANNVVRGRLDSAESKLQTQAQEIAAYMSEARTDALTGLPNRRAFDDELSRRLAEMRRHGTPISVWLGDIDRFKTFNDRFGHLAGDMVLGEVARLLMDATRESDMVARFGGEEFAMILPFTEPSAAEEVAERLRRIVEGATVYHEDQLLQVTISCGVAWARPEDTTTGLIQRADFAMYASKKAGRNLAFSHDGENCLPITEVAVPANVSRPADEKQGLLEACDDLRQKLLEIGS